MASYVLSFLRPFWARRESYKAIGADLILNVTEAFLSFISSIILVRSAPIKNPPWIKFGSYAKPDDENEPERQMGNKKVSEKNRPYTASATRSGLVHY
jgi:hypothetical protein